MTAFPPDEPRPLADLYGLFAEFEPPPPLITNLVYPPGIILLHGRPRHMKSLVAMEMAVALATGTNAFHSGRLKVPAARGALYVVGEDYPLRFKRRMEALLRSRDLQTPPDKMHVMFAYDFTLDKDYGCDNLGEYCRGNDIKLLCLDPLRRLTLNADQGPSELAPVARRLQRLQRASGAVLVLVHHDSKSAIPGKNRLSTPELASGGGIFGISEMPIHVRRKDLDIVELTPAAYKYSDDPDRIRIRSSFEGPKDDPHTITLAEWVSVPRADVDVKTRILRRLAEGPAPSGTWLSKDIRANKQAVLDALDELEADGKVICTPCGRAHMWALRVPDVPDVRSTSGVDGT